MLYLDGRQGLSEFVLHCLKLSGWSKSPTDGWRIGNRHKKESEVNHSLGVSHLIINLMPYNQQLIKIYIMLASHL